MVRSTGWVSEIARPAFTPCLRTFLIGFRFPLVTWPIWQSAAVSARRAALPVSPFIFGTRQKRTVALIASSPTLVPVGACSPPPSVIAGWKYRFVAPGVGAVLRNAGATPSTPKKSPFLIGRLSENGPEITSGAVAFCGAPVPAPVMLAPLVARRTRGVSGPPRPMNLQLITVPSTGEVAVAGVGRVKLVTVAAGPKSTGLKAGAVSELPTVTVFA